MDSRHWAWHWLVIWITFHLHLHYLLTALECETWHLVKGSVLCPVSGLGDTEPLGMKEKQERKGCAGKQGGKNCSADCATSLESFVSHERVIMSPLGEASWGTTGWCCETETHICPEQFARQCGHSFADGSVMVCLPSSSFSVTISIRETL